MMDIYKASKKRIEAGKLTDIETPGFTWVECYKPTDTELDTLSKILKIKKRELLEYIARNQRPTVVQFENHSLILVKAVNPAKWSIIPVAIFVSDRFVITVSKERIDAIERLLKSPQDVLSEQFSTAKLTKRILEEIADLYFVAMDKFEDELEKIERSLFNQQDELSVKKIFTAKKGIILVHKALTANREVIASIEKAYIPQIQKKDIVTFRGVYHDITQLIDMDETYRDILTGLLDVNLSNTSNKMNKVIKKLTAGGALILVPTFITGLYGMNFRYLPEIGWQYGYGFALGLMIVSVIALWIYFKKNDYF